MFYYLIALFVVLLDQFTKWLIVSRMNFGDSIPIIDNVLYITSHRNSGAAWGILQGRMWLFYIITIVVIVAIIYYIQKSAKGNWLLGVSLALMLGGAIGNFIDRVIRKQVVDFIHTFIFGYNFPVFNIADSALCIGVILLMILMIRDERKMKEKSYGENGTHHS
ncbi:signal peptidase II [Neobacillus massiliamazoniensis]|uniref:Lipoprotein signal peptidase n=1 Tax=Neobacillus massiliamazoniensis TaxID=1499688 RepID=A0A0U1NS45_9BACI|nr:signal peptidase II [Neobacillus massiliamazoniensis]CRK80558.1 signal peptidase II [Neobacillus massiliamazoniensis]